MIWVRETHEQVNNDSGEEGDEYYETYYTGPIEESMYEDDEIGAIFKMGQKEYGRCVSKIYIEDSKGRDRVVGWVFQKRMEYDRPQHNGLKYYSRQVWVTLYEAPEEGESVHKYRFIK
jgi:hypothetical protein